MRTRISRKQTNFWAAAVWLLCWAVGLPAQGSATFEANGPSREVAEGSIFEVSFSLKNAAGKRFIPPDFNGFRVVNGPSEMRGAGFINGQSYSHQTWTYELEAGKPGTYTIGLAVVQTNTQTLRTQPLTIRVGAARASRANAAPKSDDKVFVSGELDTDKARVGQQVHYQIKLYTQLSISDFDILDLPAFDGFYTRECRRFDTRTQYQTLRGKKYAVRILYEMALFPQEAGEILIGSARVRLGVDQIAGGGFSSLLGSTPVLMQTQAVKLRVEALPDPAPASFTGGVGQYTWKITADKDSCTTDDALTLSVTLQGNGDARRFANPRFNLPNGLEGFDPKAREEEEYETGEQFVHARNLEYVVLPKQPGDYEILPEMTIFDTDSNRYRTLRAEVPIRLHVTAGSNYGKNLPVPDTLAAPPPAPSPLATFWESTAATIGSPWFWGSLIGIILLSVAYFFWKNRRRQTSPPDKQTPRFSAEADKAAPNAKEARKRFANASRLLQHDDPRVFYHELLKSMQLYLAAWLGMNPADLTKENLSDKLAGRQIPPATATDILRVWQVCEQAVFASRARTEDMNGVWLLAQAALQQLDGKRVG